jgi:hypothetical protein
MFEMTHDDRKTSVSPEDDWRVTAELLSLVWHEPKMSKPKYSANPLVKKGRRTPTMPMSGITS